MAGENDTLNEPIAIVGMSAFFPGAPRLDRYWQNLRNGVDAIREVPPSHWDLGDHFDPDPKAKDMTYGRRGGFLSPVEIDPRDLGVAPRDLEATDTTQILGFVAAQQALADAGYGPELHGLNRDRCGVILGVTGALELVIPLGARLSHPQWRRALADAGVDAATAQDVIDRISDQFVDWREASFPGLLGNVAAGRIANRLDLHGTNCVVDAACASSLAALHLAVLELRTRRADVMLCGGVDTFNDVFMFTCFSKTPALSPTGDARPFAASGDGTILGEGVGVLVLKRLADAVAAGDRIYATIRAVGTSSDGRGNAIYAPSAEGQARALRSAYQAAQISPATVELVEAHGTGTRVGDATELEGLISVFASERPAEQEWCALGSVKSSIGHTKAAAGVAGLMKAALALWHRVIPPTIKVDAPNPVAAPGTTPFYLPTHARPWPATQTHPRRAGVSAFGFGGSNYHAVLEEAPDRVVGSEDGQVPTPDWDGNVQIIPFAARDNASLADALSGFVRDVEAPLGDLSMEERLRWHAHSARLRYQATAAALGEQVAGSHASSRDTQALRRLILVAASEQEFRERCAQALEQLEGTSPGHAAARSHAGAEARRRNSRGVYIGGSGDTGPLVPGGAPRHAEPSHAEPSNAAEPPKLGVLFPGQGSQYLGMGRDLAARFPECAAAWFVGGEPAHARKIAAIAQPTPRWTDADVRDAGATLQATQHAQPALGRFELGAFDLLTRFGVQPDAAVGHSFGELVALTAAGFLRADTLHELARVRGEAMAACGARGDAGAMVAVLADRAAVEVVLRACGTDVVLANDNGPTQVVLSGATASIEAVEAALTQAKHRFTRLPVAAAFHSPLVAGAADALAAKLKDAEIAVGHFPVWSNKGAAPYAADGADLRANLAEQIASPVRFRECIEGMIDAGVRTFVEVGPDTRLSGMVQRIASAYAPKLAVEVVSLDARGEGGALVDVAHALAAIAARGHTINLAAWDPGAQDAPLRTRAQRKAPALTITVTGANLKPKRSPRPPRETSLDPAVRPAHAERVAPELGASASGPRPPGTAPSTARAGHSNVLPPRSAVGGDTTPRGAAAQPRGVPEGQATDMSDQDTRRQGLDALVRLAEQTAHLHQLFLQQQAAATRAILGVFDPSQAQDGAAVSHAAPPPTIGLSPSAQNVMPPAAAYGAVGVPSTPAATAAHVPADHRTSNSSVPVPAPFVNSDAQTITDAPTGVAAIERKLLSVVADKTGYPIEMLEMSMGLDADLGIDSIKRVEILAALQEDLPEAATLRPDQLGELRTLGDIVAALAPTLADLPSNTAAPASTTVATAASSSQGRAAAGEVTSATNPSHARVVEVMLATVADKTGYPVEMLELSMGLDADLGIDSIKRVEILAHLQEQLPSLPSLRPDQLGELHTLGDIVAALVGDDASVASTANRSTAPVATPTRAVAPSPPQPASEPLLRLWVRPTAIPADARSRAVAPSQLGDIWLVGDAEDEVVRDLAGALALLGGRVELCSIERAQAKTGSSTELSSLGALIFAPTRGLEDDAWRVAAYDVVVACARALSARVLRGEPAMLASISRLDGCFGHANMPTEVDSAHGALSGVVKSAAWEWPGVHARALDIDPNVANSAQVDAIVSALLASGPVELGVAGGDLITTSLRASATSTASDPDLELRPTDVVLLTGGARGITAEIAFALARQGGRAFALLGRAPGLSVPLPEWFLALTRDPAFQTSTSPSQQDAVINGAILANEGAADPKSVRARRQALLGGWEVRRTLMTLESLGARAHYISCDVRDPAAVANAFAEVRAALGPVTRVVHGAGVLSDRLLIDKQAEECLAVYDTKVGGLRALLAADAQEEVGHWLLCSSSTARFGRKGQSDYALANEALVRIAQHLRASGRNALAIDFGPWAGGMVTPALMDLFAREGIDPIGLREGADQVAFEMQSRPLDAELVMLGGGTDLGALLPSIASAGRDASEHNGIRSEHAPKMGGEGASLRNGIPHSTEVASAARDDLPVLTRSISTQTHSVLVDHVLDGAAVVPTALALEWMIHAALVRAPGFGLASISELRVLKGVRISAGDVAQIRVHVAPLAASSAQASATERGFLVEMRSQSEERPLRHFSARIHLASDATLNARSQTLAGEGRVDLVALAAELGPQAASSFASPSNGHGGRNGHAGPSTSNGANGHAAGAANGIGHTGVGDVYRDLLFHGPAMQGLAQVEHLTESGVLACVGTSPRPSDWMEQPVRSRWILDPLAIDVAFQAMVLWTQRNMGLPSLPTGMERLEVYGRFPTQDCRVLARVTSRREHEVVADLEWISSDGRRIASAKGYRSVVDESLRGAYQRRVLASPTQYLHDASVAPAK